MGATRSTIDNFSASKFRAMRVPLPPLNDQVAIADFLDRETAKIDALIEKQLGLVERLEERRAHAVESVLRSNGPLVALGYFVEALPGYAFSSEGFSSDPADIPLLRGVNVKPGRIDWSEPVYWPESAAGALRDYALASGDVVLGLDRPFVGGGTRAAVVQEADLPCLLLQRVLRLRTRRNMDPRFLALLLGTRAFREYATPEFTGVSVPHLSDSQVRAFRAHIPALDQQRAFSEGAFATVSQVDTLKAKAERHIELAQERRSALITAAVTGQLDVGRAA